MDNNRIYRFGSKSKGDAKLTRNGAGKMKTRILRSIYRAINMGLSRFDLVLVRQELDFEQLAIDSYTENRILDELSSSWESWINHQNIFEPVRFDSRSVVEDFFQEWLKRPFRSKSGGTRFNNLLWLHLLARAYAPEIIVDSGTYQGASAWALSSARPGADVRSYDIDLSRLKLKAQGVEFFETDWMRDSLAASKQARSLVYFDDHVDQVRRLLEATKRNFDLLIFDDDYPITSFFHMAPSSSALPKIEFVLDDDLTDEQRLVWRYRGKELSFSIDRNYLDRARACIDATERLPFTGHITGIQQTPYRIVRLKKRFA